VQTAGFSPAPEAGLGDADAQGDLAASQPLVKKVQSSLASAVELLGRAFGSHGLGHWGVRGREASEIFQQRSVATINTERKVIDRHNRHY
jgi:hypothetical protein